MWIYLGRLKRWGTERLVAHLTKGAATPFQSPSSALPLDPTVPQRHLHSPTTRPKKQTELFPGILDCPETRGRARLFSQRKGPTAGADEPCEKPSAEGGYAPDC